MLEALSEIRLSTRAPLSGRPAEKANGRGDILRFAQTIAEAHPEASAGFDMALIGGLAVEAGSRGVILRQEYALTIEVKFGQV
mmetsp:Transcript_28846/g.72452  ORF Transcript_28846/g.72452 Transcript_28846/m.72452 type:complete len:83 (+) Transcript_28846:51-299(+)